MESRKQVSAAVVKLPEGGGRKHKQGKKQNKNESMRTRFRF